ncbi:hypothetical protein EGH24_07295 [Halonotius terrestris]|uniref:Uncharacterized protein n=1 Tax=Halonotius terrestris TaxID=2487750 RepID=A0A8J8PBU2_9EURY|nr:hypothetical protein [Halonotius terrestris]TQQ80953.1 hypothetical protein EGH24_07295 [Halonotius terrestris]
MTDQETYEKDSAAAETWALKLYLAVVVFLVGLLTVYQSTRSTDAPLVVGVFVAAAGTISIGWLLRTAI